MKKILFVFIILVYLVVALICFSMGDGLSGCLAFFVNKETQPAFFIILMLVLPVIGFPISVFLVLAGVKFGVATGLLISAVAIALHLIISFFAANSMLRPYLEEFFRKHDYQLPKAPKKRTLIGVILFILFPGLPYAVKNYGLSLSGISFGYYFAICWAGQFILAVPVIALGGYTAKKELWPALLFLVILFTGFFLLNWLKKNSKLLYNQDETKGPHEGN